jgi:hypothetical protein
VPLNLRNEPNVNMKMATARYGLASADIYGTQSPMITPAITTAAPFRPAHRRTVFISHPRFIAGYDRRQSLTVEHVEPASLVSPCEHGAAERRDRCCHLYPHGCCKLHGGLSSKLLLIIHTKYCSHFARLIRVLHQGTDRNCPDCRNSNQAHSRFSSQRVPG